MTDNLIHVKLEYEEALQSKKDVLASEMNLLRIAKAIQSHRILRIDELKTKARLHRKIKEMKMNITKLNQILPKLRIPAILEKDFPDEHPNYHKSEIHKKYEMKKDFYDSTLESQLKQIQARLKQLG